MIKSADDVKVYFVTVPAHKFLHIKNNESNGYWDFWQKQSKIPEQNCDTISGLLESIKGKLDDDGGSEANSGRGQLMAYISDTEGRLWDWGFLRSECYGVRLLANYDGEIPPQMLILDVPEGNYVLFEHGPFDYEQENRSVEEKIEAAMTAFKTEQTEYQFDIAQGKIIYMYHDPEQYFKYVRPVKKV